MIPEGSYVKGDKFTVMVRYAFRGSPANDYTVSVYSKMNLTITGVNGKPNMVFADGRSPSEFTDSAYKGVSTCASRSTTTIQ